MLVGGPDSSGYEDHADRYQYTEGALDYNGCFALACAGLANIYGGDASEWNSIAATASEINDSFSFGNNDPKETTTADQSIPTTTKVTTTRATTTTVATTEVKETVVTAADSTELKVQPKDADALEIV